MLDMLEAENPQYPTLPKELVFNALNRGKDFAIIFNVGLPFSGKSYLSAEQITLIEANKRSGVRIYYWAYEDAQREVIGTDPQFQEVQSGRYEPHHYSQFDDCYLEGLERRIQQGGIVVGEVPGIAYRGEDVIEQIYKRYPRNTFLQFLTSGKRAMIAAVLKRAGRTGGIGDLSGSASLHRTFALQIRAWEMIRRERMEDDFNLTSYLPDFTAVSGYIERYHAPTFAQKLGIDTDHISISRNPGNIPGVIPQRELLRRYSGTD